MIHLKQILLSLSAMLIGVSAVVGQKPDPDKPQTWRTYTVKGQEFAVALPGSPAITTTKTFNRPKQKTLSGQLLHTTLGRVAYSVESYENVEPKLTLDEFVTEETAQSRFDVTTEKPVTIEGFGGKEFSSPSKSSPAMVQFFATEKRLYRFSVTGADGKHAGVQRFFSSIRLGPHVAGIEVALEDPFEVDGERIFLGKEVDAKVKFLIRPEPQYTQVARQKGIRGTVVIKAVFSATGHVTSLRIVKGLPDGLTEQAIAAAKRIRFTPAMKDGKPVSIWMQLEYNFSLY